MKFNLRNRPTFEKSSPLYRHFAQDIDEWFEGFEAELQELIEFYSKPANAYLLDVKVLRKILGE